MWTKILHRFNIGLPWNRHDWMPYKDSMLVQEEGCQPTVVTYNTLIDVYGKMGHWEDAVKVLSDMVNEVSLDFDLHACHRMCSCTLLAGTSLGQMPLAKIMT